jgi:hypothetical protein
MQRHVAGPVAFPWLLELQIAPSMAGSILSMLTSLKISLSIRITEQMVGSKAYSIYTSGESRPCSDGVAIQQSFEYLQLVLCLKGM